MEYRLKPRRFHAAQWDTQRPGDLIGMLANHNTDTRREGDQLLFHDGFNEVTVYPTDWVVVDEDEFYVYADTRFHDYYEPA